jgi:hypothetical protein
VRQMFPGTATITLCPFSDPQLFSDQSHKSAFWTNTSYYGCLMLPSTNQLCFVGDVARTPRLDVSALHMDARVEHFSQPVVGMFDANMLICTVAWLVPDVCVLLVVRTLLRVQYHRERVLIMFTVYCANDMAITKKEP